jgi:hypothetical protein
MTSVRQYGKLPKARWSEDAWLALSADAQWLYSYLTCQPTTDSAGVFPIRVTKWVKAAEDMTTERVWSAARRLVEHGWIVVDHDTEEGLIRNYIRDDWAGDNIFKGALGRAVLCQSTRLRAILLHEIENLGRELKPEWGELLGALEESIPSGFDRGSVCAPTAAPSSTATTQPFRRGSDGVPTAFPSDGESFAEFDRRAADDQSRGGW